MPTKMKNKIFYVVVENLDGRKQTFQLPNDLQEPMRMYHAEQPHQWTSLLKGALINIPSSAYTKQNNYKPMIRLGKVRQCYHRPKRQKRRTRGQFLVVDNWQKQGIGHFWSSVRFVQHDYTIWNKLVLTIDYYRWRYRHRKATSKL